MADHKACVACGETKALTDFERTTGDKTRKDCKACRSSKRKAATQAARADHDRDATPRPAACSECGRGADAVEFKWRTDVKTGGWRSVCNSCINAKGYCRTYRERERVKDEAGYLARNAHAHLEWAHRNPERVAEQQAKTACEPERRIKQIKTSSAARAVYFEDADREALMHKLSEPCVFCAYLPRAGETLNGLDRIDITLGFTDANTAPCCATCNAMRGPMDIDVFVDAVRRIHRHRLLGPTEGGSGSGSGSGSGGGSGGGEGRTRLPAFGGRAELRAAPAKEKRSELTAEDEIGLWSLPCYLCGRAPAFGIDRVDADGDYTADNSRPCCTDCNYMKKDLALHDFERHVAYIKEHTGTWVLRDFLDAPLKVFGGKAREPVSPEGFDVIFPSIATAARLIQAAPTTLEDAVRAGRACRGVRWTRREPREYRNQHAPAVAVRAAIQALRA